MKLDDRQTSGIGSAENILHSAQNPSKIAVLELSTRACKLIIANVRRLQQGFKWEAFDNSVDLTDMGQLLNQEDAIPWNDFKRQVLPQIRRKLILVRKEQVDQLYCVGTAALRKATNRAEILKNIKEELGLNVRILSQEEEAEATLEGYLWNQCTQSTENTGNIVLIDQGGGSTELTGFSAAFQILDVDSSTNFPIGTTTAIHDFLAKHEKRASLFHCLERSPLLHQDQIALATKPLQKYHFKRLIGVGSAITKATNKKGNKNQHGTPLDREKLESQRQYLRQKLSSCFLTVEELSTYLETKKSAASYKKIQEDLVWYFGLGMYLQMMDQLGVTELIVNGVGLRYGICRKYLQRIYLERGTRNTREQDTTSISKIDGLAEGTVRAGKIAGINPRFGLFVQLTPAHTGLVHIRHLRKKGIPLRKFSRGKQIQIQIKQIKCRDGKLHFNLELL